MKSTLALAVAAAALTVAASAAAEPVLLISIDGLQPADVIDAEKRGFTAPNLRRLMADGAHATGVRNVLPTVTYPNHTTLITGAEPRVHGITSNTVFDPLRKNMGGWYWYRSDIKVETLWEAVAENGGDVASIGWPVSVGARSIDWNIPEYWRARTAEDLKLVEALSSPGLIAELEAATGVPFAAMMSEEVDADIARTKYAAAIMTSKKPDFMTLHLIALDHFEHEDGPGSDKAKATLAAIDAAIGELIEAARAARPNLVVAVASDHGFAEIREAVNLFIPFIEAGLVTYDADKKAVASWEAIPWGAGGTAAIMLARPEDGALQKKVGDLLASLARDPKMNIARVADAKEIARMGGGKEPSFWVDFKPGVATMGYNYSGPVVTPTDGKGTHGYFPDHREMRASFFIDGAPALRGSLGEIDMRDIAPTLGAVLGVSLDGATGKPLNAKSTRKKR